MKSWIEISAAALAANFAAVHAVAGPQFEVLAVVKADAYGHGAELCAPVLVAAGARWLGVSELAEGLRVRAALAAAGLAGYGTRLLVMCGFEPEDAPGIVEARLTPVVWTRAHIEALEEAGLATDLAVQVHLEIDTGLARQGAVPGAELGAVLDELQRSSQVQLEGVFSHLSSSEVAGSAETAKQRTRFGEALEQVAAAGLRPQWVHLGNSSAVDEGSTLAWVREHADGVGGQPLVRPGLALFGYLLPLAGSGRGSGGEVPRQDLEGGNLKAALQPVATWKTRVIGLREIAAGDTVGYGATFVAERPMRLALLPVGYADGFRREASSAVGDGWVMIFGQRCAVVGRVSMNLTMVDVTGHATVLEGDEAVLLGAGVTAEDHARWTRTIAYEILCGMRGCRRLM